ncbi:MAG: putative sulfate exporter family transporter [Marinicaulis sp.]|nr:putative sulfate exporter family transporter [Marinicaulis sp.]
MDNLPLIAKARLLAPGVFLAATIALASQFIAAQYGGPVMLYAILFGIAFNFLSTDEKCAAGVQFASKRILQAGVILLGAAVTFSEIAQLGWATALLVVTGVAATIFVGWTIGKSAGLSSPHAVLSSGAVAICGASAAMAIASVLPNDKNSERNLILTVVGVTTLSTVVMVVYPPLTHLLGFSDLRAGVFLGATIHDVAQVIGAGYIVSDDAGATAAIVKLMRVTLLAPTVLIIAAIYAQRSTDPSAARKGFPVFMLGFAALMAANSIGLVPTELRAFLSDASRWCLVIAVAALGVKTSLKDIFEVGPKPLVVLIAQTLFLAVFVGVATFAFSGALPG